MEASKDENKAASGPKRKEEELDSKVAEFWSCHQQNFNEHTNPMM